VGRGLPGQQRERGKKKSGRCRHGNRWLCAVLIEVAWAASHTKNTFLRAYYHRIARRRGKRRAIVALAHRILVIVYHVLRRRTPYRELGAGYLDELHHDSTKRYLLKRLHDLGYHATLEQRHEPALAESQRDDPEINRLLDQAAR